MTVTASQKYGFPMATVGTDPAPLRSDWMAAWQSLENLSIALQAGPVATRPAAPPTPLSWLDPATHRLSMHPGFGGVWLEVPLAADAVPVAVNPLPSSTLVTGYPLGVSVFGISAAQAASDGLWPYPVLSSVLTVKAATDRGFQLWSRGAATPSDVWYRQLGTTALFPNGPWVRLGGDTYRILSSAVAQPVATVTYVQLSWATVENSVGDLTSTVNSLTAPTAGLYNFTASVLFPGGAATPNGYVMIGLGTAGSAGSDTLYRASVPLQGTNPITVNGAWDRYMAAGASVGLFAYHSQSDSRSITSRRLTMRYVGA